MIVLGQIGNHRIDCLAIHKPHMCPNPHIILTMGVLGFRKARDGNDNYHKCELGSGHLQKL